MRHAILALVSVATCSVTSVAAQQFVEIPENGHVVLDNFEFAGDAVKATRDALIAAARSGDMDQLAAVFAQGEPPIVSFGEPGDPIEYLKGQSSDAEGREILAVLAEVLEAPFAAIDSGDGGVIFLWPYFAAMEDLDGLTAEQIVEGYRIAGPAFTEIRSLGQWLWWRVEIDYEGGLIAFVAGD